MEEIINTLKRNREEILDSMYNLTTEMLSETDAYKQEVMKQELLGMNFDLWMLRNVLKSLEERLAASTN